MRILASRLTANQRESILSNGEAHRPGFLEPIRPTGFRANQRKASSQFGGSEKSRLKCGLF